MRRAAAALLALALTSCATATVYSESTLSSAAASSVYVRVGPKHEKGAPVSHGSGVIIAKGVVLTAAHVAGPGSLDHAQGGEGIMVETQDGKEHSAITTAFGDDESEDFALLKTDTSGGTAAAISCGKPPIGTEVFSYGNPGTLKGIATWGHVASSISPDYEGAPKDAVALNMTIAPGSSGGAIFAMVDGKPAVVGIVLQIIVMPRAYITAVMMPLSAICGKLPH